MKSPSARIGAGDLRKIASRSAKSTLNPASSTRRPNRCLSPITFSFVISTSFDATRGRSSPGGARKRLRIAPSFLSIATNTKLRIRIRVEAWAQFRARSMKSDVPNSKMTVLQSHANDAARCIVFSAAGGNSLVVKFDITADAVPTASLIGSPAAAAMLAHVDRSEVDAGSMGSAGAGVGVMPALCALAEGSMTRQLLLPLHQCLDMSYSNAGSLASITFRSMSTWPFAHCNTSRWVRERWIK
mmetsp:Transcript_64058/g.143156  ORF Transcript_64058/g.143156 Transcript_64058/m.143156 type:complete len:243 (-) Transcript_64058:781-1509(-)